MLLFTVQQIEIPTEITLLTGEKKQTPNSKGGDSEEANLYTKRSQCLSSVSDNHCCYDKRSLIQTMWGLPLSHPLVHLLKIESGLHSCPTEAELHTINSAENQNWALREFKREVFASNLLIIVEIQLNWSTIILHPRLMSFLDQILGWRRLVQMP